MKKKKFLTLVSIIVAFGVLTTNVHAANKKAGKFPATGTGWMFDKTDYTAKKRTCKQKTMRAKYLTDSWCKSSKYVWSKTNSVATTVGGKVGGTFYECVTADLNLSRTKTYAYSIAVHIDANRGRYSKLALYVRYNVGTARITKTKSYYISFIKYKITRKKYDRKYKEPTKTSFVKVVYK